MRLYVCHAEAAWFARERGTAAVKIGVSREPKRRKWGLRRPGCESPKLIWQSAEMDRARAFAIENVVKKRLADRCVGGAEWFDLAPDRAVRIVRDAIREYYTPQQWKEAKALWQDETLTAEEAAARAKMGMRSLYRRFGPKGSPAFGRKGKGRAK